MSSEDKSRLLGLFLWLFTAFNIVIIAVIGIIYVGLFGVIFSQAPHKASDPPPELIVGIIAVVFVFILVFTVLFSIPKVIAGYGLRKHKSWARPWAIAASIMCCLSFPFGTAIGVFGLIFLLSDEGKAYFENRSYAQVGAGCNVNPPPPNSWQ